MSPANAAPTLGKTPTDWALLQLAHSALPSDARLLWTRVLSHYGEPVRHALKRLVRDADVADELNQEFWYRFLRGDFAHATPARGRFRNLLKTVLVHLVVDHFRRRRRESPLLTEPAESEFDLATRITHQHAEIWREQLIARTRQTLAEDAGTAKQVCPDVLTLETEQPQASSSEKAALLSARLGRTVSAENYRQILHRTRARFTELLYDEVRHSLSDPSDDAVREELAELDLLRFCE